MPDLPSWNDLQTEFRQYAIEHADLRAMWTWVYTRADQSVKRPPHGDWTLSGGSPGSPHLFKEVIRRAAGRLPDPSGAEPWRRWLDLLRTEGYARKISPKRVPFRQFKATVESGQLVPLPPGFESEHIENLFKSSADFCFVRSLAEPPVDAIETPADKNTYDESQQQRLGDAVDLLDEHVELLQEIVAVYNTGCRSEFMVIRLSGSESGLAHLLYPDRQLPIKAGDTDFQRLAREDFLDLRCGPDGILRGKPTTRGVRFVEKLRTARPDVNQQTAIKGAMLDPTTSSISPDEAPGTNPFPTDSRWGHNPFPKEDPRHQEWCDEVAWFKEHLGLFRADMFNRRSTGEASAEEHRLWILDLISGQFDILAYGASRAARLTDQAAHDYEEGLEQFEKICLAQATKFRFSFVPIRDIQMTLEVRKQYWMGQLLKQIREAKERKQLPPPTAEEAEDSDGGDQRARRGAPVPAPSEAKKPVRRNQKYRAIDEALRKVAESHPRSQEEVFQSLDGRHVVIPTAEPFIAARGWIAGFRRDSGAARAWLSKRWAELNLSPLPRGPKKPKK